MIYDKFFTNLRKSFEAATSNINISDHIHWAVYIAFPNDTFFGTNPETNQTDWSLNYSTIDESYDSYRNESDLIATRNWYAENGILKH